MLINEIVDLQRNYFSSGITLFFEHRLDALDKLEETLRKYEKEILAALKADLGKSEQEAYMTELGLVYSSLKYTKKHLRKWSKPKRVKTPLVNFRGKSWRLPSPYGNVLIMSPWNYPILLTLDPLIGALSAGNTVVVKPGSYSKNVSDVLAKIIAEAFPPEYVTVVLGGRKENTELLDTKFDYIFFTGSPAVGKIVQAKASVHLTPISLELGGKSPAIVDETAKINLAARRLVFGKYTNVGQTCIAPDYVLVHDAVYEKFIAAVKNEIVTQFGENPLLNKDYGKIINEHHFDRLLGLINEEKLVHGGESNRETLQIAPTVLKDVTLDDAVMGEEIFGPIMPIIKYHNDEELEPIILHNPTPLAFYIFSERDEFIEHMHNKISFGGGSVNDTLQHIASHYMPFGGVGNSGMGSYHGKWSFDTFTHYKSIYQKKAKPDLSMRYQPYTDKNYKQIRKFVK